MAQIYGASSYGDGSTANEYDPGEFWRVTPPDSVAGASPVVGNLLVTNPGTFVFGETVEFEFTFSQLPIEEQLAYRDRHDDLRDYELVTGAYATGEDVNHRPWFREQHNRDGRTAVVGVIPPDSAAEDGSARGLWGLVDAIEDRTDVAQTRWALGFEVLFLAEHSEYADADAVKRDLEASGLPT